MIKYQSHSKFNVHHEKTNPESEAHELPDDWWYRIYAAVIVATIVVISALSAFSRYFSS